MVEYDIKLDKQSYTLEEATELREKLLAERRAFVQNIKILKGIEFKTAPLYEAIRQYESRVEFIDGQIRHLADHVKLATVVVVPCSRAEMTEQEFTDFIMQCVSKLDTSPNGSTFILEPPRLSISDIPDVLQ